MDGIIEKFEAHNMIAQVNRLENALDDFKERRLGESQAANLDRHWAILGRLKIYDKKFQTFKLSKFK
jgi:hypothetical protein